MAAGFRLSIRAAAGAPVHLACPIHRRGGKVQELERKLRAFADLAWRAEGIACRITAHGPLEVEAERNGSRTRLASGGGTVILRLGRPPAE